MPFACKVYALDAAAKRRLKLAGVPVPISSPSGQDPTPAEIRAVLTTFTDYQINVTAPTSPMSGGWHAEMWHAHRPASQPWCLLAIDPYLGEANRQSFRFVRGTPELMVQIVSTLAARLGPLVLQPDSSQPPVVIQQDFESTAYVDSWKVNEPPPIKHWPIRSPVRLGEPDLVWGLIDPLLQQPVGFKSKHRFDEWDLERRLSLVDWFAKCGQPCHVDLSVGIERVEDWDHAQALCASPVWEDVELEAQNQLTSFLHHHDHDNYQHWNRFVADRKQNVLEPLLRQRIEPFQQSQGLPDRFLHGVRWDLLGALMEEMYAESGYDGFFFAELLMVYESGHFPCGWAGAWPQGQLFVY